MPVTPSLVAKAKPPAVPALPVATTPSPVAEAKPIFRPPAMVAEPARVAEPPRVEPVITPAAPPARRSGLIPLVLAALVLVIIVDWFALRR